jgi:hypothetical protein
MRLRFGMSLVLIVTIVAACAPRGPIVDTGPKPPGVGGTISGTVRAAGDGAPVSARKVTAINVDTGARAETSTATNGGYTLKVPVGKYRLEIELRAGESLAEQPSVTEVNASDLDTDRDFVISVKGGAERAAQRALGLGLWALGALGRGPEAARAQRPEPTA